MNDLDMGLAEWSRKYSAWAKANTIYGRDPKNIRQDMFGNEIHYDQHGKLTRHGWEVDHIRALANGGLDIPENRHALAIHENRSKSDMLLEKYIEFRKYNPVYPYESIERYANELLSGAKFPELRVPPFTFF